ncbi:MAG: SdrD B-like domain-containing protein, partial [Acidobacteriota bacterium]
FLVNTDTEGPQTEAAISVGDDGDFVVVWRDEGPNSGDTDGGGIRGQRFDGTGSPLAGQFLVNSYTTSLQLEPDVGVAADGRFVVVWSSYGSDNGDTSTFGIQGQLFDAAGDPVGDQLRVNDFTTFAQRAPSIGVDPAGDFVVTWRSYGSDNGDTSLNSVQGRRFSSSGDPVADQFLVNSYTFNQQREPSVAVDAAGDFVVAWQSLGAFGDTSGYSVQMQKYRTTGDIGDLVFQDIDGDGRQSVSDRGAPDVTVHLRSALGDLLATTTTDADGAFLFRPKVATQGVADELFLEFESGPTSVFTTPDVGDDDTLDSDVDSQGLTPTVTLTSAGEGVFDLDAGLVGSSPGIGDRVWLDANADGIQQIDEIGAADVTLRLLDEAGAVVGTVLTDADGIYRFPGVGDGVFRVEIELPPGAALGPKGAGELAIHDSDFDPVTLQTDSFTYASKTIRRELDAGLVLPGTQVPTVFDGETFQVNTYTTGDQRDPRMAADAAGNFVVVWDSTGAVGDSLGRSIVGQRYAEDGSPAGGEFLVNSYTTGDQYGASIGMNASGAFVVTWDSYGYENGDTSYRSVQGQRYDAAGAPQGPQFIINTYTTDIQNRSDVAVGADGSFVVVWQSEGGFGDDDSGYSIQGQRYSPSGDPVAGQ